MITEDRFNRAGVVSDDRSGADAQALAPEWGELTPLELQNELLSYADRYMEGIAEAADSVVAQETDPATRSLFLGTKVIYVSSALNIAAESDTGAALLDMYVMVSLQRSVWTEAWSGQVDPDYAATMARALTRLHRELDKIAGKVLKPLQLEQLRALVEDWRQRNPEQLYVAFVRFNDFPHSQSENLQAELAQEGGLLAPVRKAAREVEEIKLLAERGIFLANHFPIVMEWQMEHLFSKIEMSPLLTGLAEDSDEFVATSVRLADAMEALPDRLSLERAAMLEDLALRVAAERQQTLNQLFLSLDEQRADLLRDLEQGSSQLIQLLQSVEQSGTVLRDTAKSLETLFGGDKPPPAPGEPSGLETLDRTLGNISGAAVELNLLTGNLESLATGGASALLLDDIEARLRAQELRLFLYAAGLILLFFVLLTAYRLAIRDRRSN
ncbi:hypothetical protein GCM10011348_06070 [Marinobacterium nitratireducens]|uniref:Uncharacterized protein n=1 Tax=Marinobacterium nitratireducens TaxID=518897 RepID=A0A917Z8S1_9GAMM|nr:hypothetical protein [Marinobacterium nitratireducens]GGO77150.1 hypothetical protein GCM10011348_06070 [Marinobacterium nitratireducens]